MMEQLEPFHTQLLGYEIMSDGNSGKQCKCISLMKEARVVKNIKVKNSVTASGCSLPK